MASEIAPLAQRGRNRTAPHRTDRQRWPLRFRAEWPLHFADHEEYSRTACTESLRGSLGRRGWDPDRRGIQGAAPLPPVCDAGTQRGAAASGAGSLSGGSTITNAHISATTAVTSRRARSSGTRRGDVIMMTSKAVEVSTPMRNWTL